MSEHKGKEGENFIRYRYRKKYDCGRQKNVKYNMTSTFGVCFAMVSSPPVCVEVNDNY